MPKRLLVLLIFLNISVSYGQTIKTDVLVIGGTPNGVAAAIQSARSKAKTILIERGPKLCPGIAAGSIISADLNLPSGIWGEFRNCTMERNNSLSSETTFNAPLKLQEGAGINTITHIADTVKNLEIRLKVAFTSAKKDGGDWAVSVIQNGRQLRIKARVIIDATDASEVLKKLGAKYSTYDVLGNNAQSPIYRTSIAMGDDVLASFDTLATAKNYPSLPGYCVPVKALIAQGADNLLVTGGLFQDNDLMFLPLQLTLGQGAGAIAAYCAVFKTNTANLKVRAIQTALLDFKGYLLPFEDISTDPQWRAIQQVCVTGILKGVKKSMNGSPVFLFDPDAIVTTDEIKPVLLEIYTRAFSWFKTQQPGRNFTLRDMVSLISEITLTDPDILRKDIIRAWHIQYKLKSDFDIDRPITRREFAILTNQYLNPFAKTVDLDGKVVN